MDWLRRILRMLLGGDSEDRDDDRQASRSSRDRVARDDAVPMNESGSPDERDEGDRVEDGDGDGGGDGGGGDGDGGGGDGGSDD